MGGGGWGGELVALLGLSSWCLVMVGRLFLAMPQGCLRFVIVVFPDHTHLLFFICWCRVSVATNGFQKFAISLLKMRFLPNLNTSALL